MRSLTLILGLTLLAYATAEEVAVEEESVAGGLAQFSADLFKQLSNEKQNKNLAVSPLSAYFTLSLIAAGAGGNTAKQLQDALHLPLDDAVLREGFVNLIKEMSNTTNATVEIANKIYLAKDLKVKADFDQLTRDVFNSEVANIDVAKQAESAEAINQWVKEKTHDKINKIIEEDDITDNSLMFLLNTIYFKNEWQNQFYEEDTMELTFQLDNETEKEVPTMMVDAEFLVVDFPDLKAKTIQIPYLDDDLKMYIILPNEIDGLSHVQENLHLFNISSFASADYEDFEGYFLYLPKFKIESSHELEDTLMKLGMSDMFGPGANFTGIADESMEVSKITQKVFISVDEKGTEAAAVTAGSLDWRFGPGTAEFHVDHPFVYIVAKKDVILFVGSVVDPTEE